MTISRPAAGPTPEPGRRQPPPGDQQASSQPDKRKDSTSNSFDPLGMATPIVQAQLSWLLHPQELGERVAMLSSDLWRLQWHSWQRMLGVADADPIPPNADDARFADPAWSDSPTWDLVKEWYLAFTRHSQDMLYDTPGLSDKERRRAAFWWRNWLNAVAPTNYLWTNPVALRKAVESRGDSLAKGFQNFLDDLRAGNVRMTDPEDFAVGQNLATTPGSVVFRNRLLEVIHYTPTRPQVHTEPVVIITPWINKFYVLDLTPKNSMIRFLLDQGLDVYITSWKNPDASMSEVSFDDYLTEGIDTAVQVARRLAKAEKVHATGYCIGGTALAMYMAWANRRYGAEAAPVADGTFLTTLVDFHKPGDIEVFIDNASVRYLCSQMEQNGYLDGKEMASAFRFLRPNSLIWHYVVRGWLYGETLPPFDVLYWNMDTTRMPKAMHSWYLTELYLHNKLIQPGALTVAGEALDLSTIHQPMYVVAAEDDHIAPWDQTFKLINHGIGEKRFILSSSGHIIGIINPPVTPPKRRYWVDTAHRSDRPEHWRQRAEERPGSWWEDWMAWLKPKAGALVDAPPTSTKEFPELAPAPGSYVLER
ncbi:alpha/beta hydrolase [Pseudogulbenkiania sp. MAI-1]|uniref:PHA/PHB synthase family protein n=1 Tax=Pseudogulbenkiania sp. MAI-1 TaxID=990370 RepID=UPI00045EC40E|nr:alpha/beta fold hydrolase [Pseudogulbenkiania sp. MAI-1]